MKNTIRFPRLLDCDIFHDLSEEHKADFLNQFSVRTFAKRTAFLHQGEHPGGMFLISHGSVEVSFLSEDGYQTIIFHAGPKDILGAIEALAAKPCAATCVAMPDTCVLYCPTPLLFQKLQSPVMIRNVAMLAFKMIERDNSSKAIDQHYTVEQRICSHLWQLSAQGNDIRQSQSYLATMVGCSRQTVNKELGALREHGIIASSKGKITVLDRDALQRRISSMAQNTG